MSMIFVFVKKLFAMMILSLIAMNISVAATFDFVSYADDDADNDGHYEWGYDRFSVKEDNIKLTASGHYWAKGAWQNAYAYLDRGNAGLGVCKKLDAGSQCNPASDDNVTPREMLWLRFDQTVVLDQVVFTNGSHGTDFNGSFLLTVFSEGSWGPWVRFTLAHLFNTDLTGDSFAFYNPNKGSDNTKQFYLDSLSVTAVPVPAALWLFGSSLLGFVALRRRVKTRNATT